MIVVIRSAEELRRRLATWRESRESVGLVPTMGAFHDGHLALVKRARASSDRVIVSIFVNPIQFGPGEDLDAYPRDETSDRDSLDALGVDVLYAPTEEEMYPQGFSTSVKVSGLTERFCGANRPLHFEGVTTVVAKLLMQSLPDIAFFGEKDYQQLQVIKKLVRDLAIPVRIESVETVREADGLALSSRNAYLSPQERAVAPALYRVLNGIAAKLGNGHDPRELMETGRKELSAAGFTAIDYLELCDAETLGPIETPSRETPTRPARVLAAVRLGHTRLIDNVSADPARKNT